MGRYNHSLSLDAAIVVSTNCPIIGEHVVIIFVNVKVAVNPLYTLYQKMVKVASYNDN